jgi:pSer/pThr/pTyr-binding forkhead associated (FHA) protein
MQGTALSQRAASDDASPVSLRLEGAGVRELFELRDERPLAVVGRGATCDLQLQDVEVSRRHALLVRWGADIYCLDLGSRSGTRVASESAAHGWLTAGYPATIGSYRLVVSGDRPSRSPSLALHRDRLPGDRTHDWQLEFVAGEVQPSRYTLRRPLTLIGRKPFCKIQLKVPKIQSVHAALLVTSGGLYLRDLSGRGALRVDGQAWFSGWLRHGQIVELGDVQIRIAQTAAVGIARLPDAETDDPAGSVTLESIERYRVAARAGTGEPSGTIVESPDSVSSEVAAAPATPRPLTDVVLSGRYQIVKRLARGGMGVVYRGLDQRLHRQVAVKVVRGRSEVSGLGRLRLLREAMVCSRLDHSNIIRVLDVDKDGRYAVFEFVSGETLGDRLRRHGPLPPAEAAHWVAQVADAVEHMGQHGIVHRDIKPANVLLAPNGLAKLVDFGLAYLADAGDCEKLAQLSADTERPRKGIAIGTAPFASPEQFENCLCVDTRSDIYSVGCTLYSILAGRPPYYGTLSEMCRLHRESPLQPIVGLPPVLMSIIERCLAKLPAERFQTGAELAAELRAFVQQP